MHATEHASFGLGRHSVVPTLPPLQPGWFAEAFLGGAEYNVSLLADGRGGCSYLPVAELVYAEDWPPDMPRILDYAGKWDRSHPLYARTTRRFADPAGVRELARDAWHALGLDGYARIDLRAGPDGVPRVIDVNANPCLSEDAGFAAAAAAAGMDYTALVGRIAALALDRPAQASAALRPLRAAAEHRLRWDLVAADRAAIGALCRATGFFSDAEIAIAEELAADRLARGAASDYRFVIAEGPNGAVLAYACFGPMPAARSAWDLYWIVVDPAHQGAGLGRLLLDAVLARAEAAGATQLYAETEATPTYAPTRAFYAGCGFHLQAVLPDFFAPGAAKQIWVRSIGRKAMMP
jgi:D-alanine-D-alanine ligase